MDSEFLPFLGDIKYSIQPAREKGGCRVYFRYGGKPVFLSVRDGSGKPVRGNKEAEKLAPEIIKGWWTNLRTKPPEPVKDGLLLEDRVRAFIKSYYDPAYYSAGTIGGVEDNLEEMLKLLPGYTLRGVTRKVFRELVVPVIKARVKPKTWANKLDDMRRFFKWELEQEDEDGNPHLEADPTIGTKRPPKSAYGTREKIWEEEWYPLVQAKLKGELKDIFEDFWFTGMDTKDLWQLEPLKHVKQDGKGFWKIFKKRAKESEIIDQPLNSKIRERWVARRAACKVGDKLHPNSFKTEKTWGNWVRNQVQEVLKELGLPKVDIKSTRHTFATRHVKRLVRGEKNAPTLDEVRRWMGHAKASRELEKVYARLQSSAELMD